MRKATGQFLKCSINDVEIVNCQREIVRKRLFGSGSRDDNGQPRVMCLYKQLTFLTNQKLRITTMDYCSSVVFHSPVFKKKSSLCVFLLFFLPFFMEARSHLELPIS